MIKLQELTEKAIQDETNELAAEGGIIRGNLMDVFRENYENWTLRLFPILRARGKKCYAYIADLLRESGFGEVSVSQVGAYMSRVKKERSRKKGCQ